MGIKSVTKGLKNLTKNQKWVLDIFIRYHNVTLMYHIRNECYILNGNQIISTRTANALIKRNILKLRSYCLAYSTRYVKQIPMTKEIKVQIALGLIEPVLYVYELDQKYYDRLENILRFPERNRKCKQKQLRKLKNSN